VGAQSTGEIIMTRLLSGTLAVAALCACSGLAFAQEASQQAPPEAPVQPASPWERFSLNIGGFAMSSNTELRVDSTTTGVGAVVDLENTLGVESRIDTYRADMLWRFGGTRRHQLELHYYTSKRDGSQILDEDVTIGDVTFPAGEGVDSTLDISFINLDYGYAFFQDDRIRLSAAIGLHTTGIEFQVNAPSVGLFESESFTAPLPVLGLSGDFIVTPRWRLKASLSVLYLGYEGATGVLTDSLMAVEYLPFKHLGFGAGLNTVRYRLESDEEDSALAFQGKFGLTNLGALLYVKMFF
jgi:hypothetical protein